MPRGITEVQAFLVGGGSGKNVPSPNSLADPSSGGGGGYTTTCTINTLNLSELNVTIGAGAGYSNGGATSVGSNTANGATDNGPYTTIGGYNYWGGSGGSGGGSLGVCVAYGSQWGGDGGSDGGDGKSDWGTNPNPRARQGTGQGTTTRAFGESDGTLYSGGGGGAVVGFSSTQYPQAGGAGGAGGGGNGALRAATTAANLGVTKYIPHTNGGANTGGGGGGIIWGYGSSTGGSGIAIIRWGY